MSWFCFVGYIILDRQDLHVRLATYVSGIWAYVISSSTWKFGVKRKYGVKYASVGDLCIIYTGFRCETVLYVEFH